MVTTTRLGLFILGFLAATGVEAVRADEAYLCEGGRVVKVPLGKLEEMKRTDACIARYYGLTVKSSTPLETGTITPHASVAPTAVTPPTAIAPDEPRRGPSESEAQPAAELPKPAPVRQASAEKPSPPRAAVGTDYRNVVLLNAAPGEPAIFRHDR